MEDRMPASVAPAISLAGMSRPALLVRAARLAQNGYRRRRDLARLLRIEAPQDHVPALELLQAAEAEMETRRRARAGGYLPSAHVALLAALLAEARGPS